MILHRTVLLAALFLASSLAASAQFNTSLKRDTTDDEAKKVAYPYIFPIFGKEVVARGLQRGGDFG